MEKWVEYNTSTARLGVNWESERVMGLNGDMGSSKGGGVQLYHLDLRKSTGTWFDALRGSSSAIPRSRVLSAISRSWTFPSS